MRFFLHFSKNYCIFAPVISPRLGIMSFGWGGCRHNKALKALCVWLIGISQILTVPTHCSILMSSGCVYSIRSYFIMYARVCTYRRGLECCLFGTEGDARASISGTATVQVPLFCCNTKCGNTTKGPAFLL